MARRRRGWRRAAPLVAAACCALVAGAGAATGARSAAPAVENVSLAWIGLDGGIVRRLFSSDPVARVRVADPEARVVEVLVGGSLVDRATVAAPGTVELPVALLRTVAPGGTFSVTVRVTGADGSRVERAFGPVTLGRKEPPAIARLTHRWGSPARVRLDWVPRGGHTPAAVFVVRRGGTELARLPSHVRLYRVATSCTTATTYTVVSVSADGLESAPATTTVPAGSCPRR